MSNGAESTESPASELLPDLHDAWLVDAFHRLPEAIRPSSHQDDLRGAFNGLMWHARRVLDSPFKDVEVLAMARQWVESKRRFCEERCHNSAKREEMQALRAELRDLALWYAALDLYYSFGVDAK